MRAYSMDLRERVLRDSDAGLLNLPAMCGPHCGPLTCAAHARGLLAVARTTISYRLMSLHPAVDSNTLTYLLDAVGVEDYDSALDTTGLVDERLAMVWCVFFGNCSPWVPPTVQTVEGMSHRARHSSSAPMRVTLIAIAVALIGVTLDAQDVWTPPQLETGAVPATPIMTVAGGEVFLEVTVTEMGAVSDIAPRGRRRGLPTPYSAPFVAGISDPPNRRGTNVWHPRGDRPEPRVRSDVSDRRLHRRGVPPRVESDRLQSCGKPTTTHRWPSHTCATFSRLRRTEEVPMEIKPAEFILERQLGGMNRRIQRRATRGALSFRSRTKATWSRWSDLVRRSTLGDDSHGCRHREGTDSLDVRLHRLRRAQCASSRPPGWADGRAIAPPRPR